MDQISASMRKILLSALLLSAIFSQAQHTSHFYTPWYGAIGFHTISTRYSGGGTEIKAPLTYADLRAVFFTEKGYMEFGLPVTGYILTGVIATGDLPNDNGEVPFLFAKGGWDVVKSDIIRIGLGASLNTVLINVDGIEGYGASLESYGTLSPMLFAKINLGPFLVVPVFEYNALSFANATGTTRPGFSFGSHCVIPLGKRIAVNLNPVIEKGTFRNEVSGSMKSVSVAFNAGLVVRPG